MPEKLKEGDFVRVSVDSEVLQGILMPSTKNILVLKLENGYNIGIDTKKIKKIELIKQKEKKEKKLEKLPVNRNLKNILILHTGGTFASKVDYKTGAVSPKFEPEELIGMFPELKNIANIKSKLLFNVVSEDIRFSGHNSYKKIAKEVYNNADKFDGIIITHGTDAMHYTASALAFMLENLHIPVILVGAQRSSDRGSSDAFLNLYCAAIFINKIDFPGVGICMHDSSSDDSCVVLPACKTRKLHTSRRDAFKAVNSGVIARITREGDILELTKIPEKQGKLTLKDKFEEKTGILRFYPNISAKQINQFKNYKGLVIEGSGLGHVSADIITSIKNLVKSGVVVVMTSQCIFGRVSMNVYSRGRELLNIGVISGEDMTTETAYIKLAWLLANYRKNEVKGLITKNLRNEISERSVYEEKFIEF